MLRFADKQVLPGLRRALPVVLSLALVLSGLGGLVALAEEAAVEVAEVGTFSGTLPGNRDSGSFAVYEVSYAGAELLTATVTPLYRDASQGPAFGMKLYLPDGSAVRTSPVPMAPTKRCSTPVTPPRSSCRCSTTAPMPCRSTSGRRRHGRDAGGG